MTDCVDCKRCGFGWRGDKVHTGTGLCPNCLRAIGANTAQQLGVGPFIFTFLVNQAKPYDHHDEPEVAAHIRRWEDGQLKLVAIDRGDERDALWVGTLCLACQNKAAENAVVRSVSGPAESTAVCDNCGVGNHRLQQLRQITRAQADAMAGVKFVDGRLVIPGVRLAVHNRSICGCEVGKCDKEVV